MEIHQLMMKVSAALNRCRPQDFGPAIESVLETIGRFYGAQRSYIFSIDRSANRLNKRFEWHEPNVTPISDSFTEAGAEIPAWLMTRFRLEEVVHIPSASEISPVTGKETKQWISPNYRSLLAAPLFLDRRLFGVIGVDVVEAEKIWGEPEIGCFKTLAALIANAWNLLQLDKERNLLWVAAEHAHDLIVFTDSAGNIEYVNPAFERVTGYPRDEVIGRNPRILKSGRHNRLFYQEMWHTLNQGNAWSGYFINRRKDGSLYNEDAVIAPIKDEAGQIVNYVGVKRDTTQQDKLERKLVQSQKMEAIGTLAGGIAHDFNNILAAILGYAELALYEIPEDNRGRDDVTEVVKAANRARDLVRQILTFGRETEPDFKSVDMSPLLNEVLKFLRASLPSTIDIRPDICTQPIHVMSSPTQIQQVVMNLCTNAAYAMQDSGGILEVSLRQIHLETEVARNHPELLPGRYARLAVKDNGPGIDPNIIGRIFDPYFTTKEKGEGTGLGLAVVHGIAIALKGTVEVESRLGEGTTFYVYLPLVLASTKSSDKNDRTLPTGTERILVVDDEDALAKLGRLVLKRLGYGVTVTTSSREALKTFRASPDQFDLVVSDKTMPQMTGLELAAEIRKIRRDFPVIVCTGYSSEAEIKKANQMGVAHLLVKPLTMEDLAQAVRIVLDKKKEERS